MKHSIGKILPAGATTTIFTVPQGYIAEVSMVFVSNHTASAKTITVSWMDVDPAPTTDIELIFQKSLNAKEYLTFADGTFVLQAGDSIRAVTEAASDFNIIVTFDLRKEKPLYSFI